MRVMPTWENVLIKRSEASGVSKGGIIIPDSGKERPQQGKIIAVGPLSGKSKEGRAHGMALMVGDTVLFSAYAGKEIRVDGDELFLISSHEILAVVKG